PTYHLAGRYNFRPVQEISRSQLTIQSIHKLDWLPSQIAPQAEIWRMAFVEVTRLGILDKKQGRAVDQRPDAQNGQTCCVTSPWQHSGQNQPGLESIHYKVHKNTDNVLPRHE